VVVIAESARVMSVTVLDAGGRRSRLFNGCDDRLVDEINRGDVPRIFGELITVIEHDKRDTAVTLPVHGLVLRSAAECLRSSD
jgi:hypothetical protein